MDQAPLLDISESLPAHAAAEAEAQQIIACLLLANLSSRVLAHDAARRHLADALEIAQALSRQIQTVRTIDPMKMLQISVTSAGLAEKLVLPIVEDSLIVPDFRLLEADGALHDALLQGFGATSCDMQIIYATIRLRTSRIAHALHGLLHAESAHSIDQLTETLLGESLRATAPDLSPLDVADDYISLALDLVRQRNVPLAGSILRNAEGMLDHYAQSAAIEAHLGIVTGMKKQILSITKALNMTAS